MGCSWSLRGEVWELISSRKKRVMILLGLAFLYGNGLWACGMSKDEGIIAASNQGVMVDTKLHASPTTELDDSIGTLPWWFAVILFPRLRPGRIGWYLWLVDPTMYWTIPQKKTGLCQLQAAMHGAERGFNTAWCHISFSFSQAFLEMWSNDYKKLRHILKNYEKNLNNSKFLAAWMWCSLLGCCWMGTQILLHTSTKLLGRWCRCRSPLSWRFPTFWPLFVSCRVNGTKPYGTHGLINIWLF